MEITLNGSPHSVVEPCTIAQLVEDLGYAGKRVALERNGTIVPRSAYAQTALEAQDQIEIVVAVGGG